MNLIMLFPSDFITANKVRLNDHRHHHILTIPRPQTGTNLTVGLLNHTVGTGTVTLLDREVVEMEVKLHSPAPMPLPLTLILALPRPKMLKRVFQTVAAMGVKKLILLNSYRVEKSFWHSPALVENRICEQLLQGLEQAKDTLMPEVLLRKRFKPFVEDELPELCKNSRALVAHPKADTPCPRQLNEPVTLAVGPEGGFISYEVDKLQACGFSPIHLGERILRVETAIPALLGRIF
ncbi:MAG: 16S rRNA (uracil(1498)-N(3))-methyltransferase [Exilibacterium sp.]